MHKTILMLLLAVVSSSAMAEWVVISDSDDLGITVYADPSSIRKSGNKVKMWILFDFSSVHEASGTKSLSSMVQDEFDCKEEQLKTLHFTWYSKNMGRGDVVYTGKKYAKNWTPVYPDSSGKTLWKFACGK